MNVHRNTHFRRQRRRLPHVQRPPRSRPLTFWPTYRGAVEWVRRNQTIIETTVGLLEIYPALIQEMALDALWDFMSPFLAKFEDKGGRSRCSNQSENRHTSNATTTGGRGLANGNSEARVPVISITYAADDQPESEFGDAMLDHNLRDDEDDGLESRTPRVYVCYRCKHHGHQDRLHRHVLHALQHDFYVRTGPCAAHSRGSCAQGVEEEDGGEADTGHRYQELREADACVFVLDDSSLNSPACYKDLCAAWAFDLPTLFLKDCNYALPTPLPDVLLQYNLGLEPLRTSRSTSPSVSVRSRYSPSPTLSNRSNRLTKGLSFPPLRASSAKSLNGRKRRKEHEKASLREADLVLMMLNGYRDALVFEEDKGAEYETELRTKLHEMLGTGGTEGGGRASSSCGRGPSSVSRTPNTLQPAARSGGRQGHSSSQSFLAVPSGARRSPTHQDSFSSLFSDNDNDDDDSAISISISTSGLSHASSSHSDLLSPQPQYWSDGALSPPSSRSNSPPPTLFVPTTFDTSGGSRLTRNTATAGRRPQNQHSRSFTHLHQFQQQLQQDRASFLSHTSLGHHHDDDFLPDVSDGRQTVYMVCSKSPKSPNREPRLVKWPPSPDTAENERRGEEEEEEGALEVGDTLSDVFSDSPVSFRDLDLSVVINRRSAGTPDSDASTFF